MGERDEIDRWLDEIVAMSAQTERHLFTPEQEARVAEIVAGRLASTLEQIAVNTAGLLEILQRTERRGSLAIVEKDQPNG